MASVLALLQRQLCALRSLHGWSFAAAAAAATAPAPVVRHLLAVRGYALGATLTRSPQFAQVEERDLAFFQGVVGEAAVVTDAHAMSAFNRDWMGKYEGASSVCVRPKSTGQVASLLRYCNERRLAVVPQGGNTGLVGGSVPLFDEVVMHLGNLNRVTSFDEGSGVLVCGAGCVLEALDRHVAERGFMVPLDLGAKGSCHIGGNVSTNAGGLRLLRYGSLHGSVLGLEVVLADGRVLDMLSTLRKDNTGYDLKQLFIGAEGTLGVVTAVSLLCVPRPSSVQVAYLACPSFDAVQRVYAAARRRLGEILSAFEFLDDSSRRLALAHIPGVVDPLPGCAAPFYLVVEAAGSGAEHDAAKLEGWLEEVMATGDVEDGTLAQDGAQAASIWLLRESISEALRHAGAVYKYDLSMPLADMYSCVEATRERLAGQGMEVEVVGYGHLGDGNLHLNISAPAYCQQLTDAIEPWVYEWTAQPVPQPCRRSAAAAAAAHGAAVALANLTSAPPTCWHGRFSAGHGFIAGPKPALAHAAARKHQRGARPRADEGGRHWVQQAARGGGRDAAGEAAV